MKGGATCSSNLADNRTIVDRTNGSDTRFVVPAKHRQRPAVSCFVELLEDETVRRELSKPGLFL